MDVVDMSDLPAIPGTYALLIEADTLTQMSVGQLGNCTLASGSYIYVGSAHGAGGLRARVRRHLRIHKPLRWHVDYLTTRLPIVGVIVTSSDERLECAWARKLLSLPGASAPVTGFGSSDCRGGCPAHLVRLPDGYGAEQIRDVLNGTLMTLIPQNGADSLSPLPLNASQPTDLVQALLDAIGARDDDAAERAAQACAGRVDLLPALRPLLADADLDRRWWAVRTVALIRSDEAAALLLGHLADPDEPTRCAAALGLGQQRSIEAIPALAARLADESGWVRDSAADALALIGSAALPMLVEIIADQRDGVRVRAASALRKIIASELTGRALNEIPPPYWLALNALFVALNDPNRLVRHNAFEALDRLGLLETVFVAE